MVDLNARPQGAANYIANRFGHEAGRRLAKTLWKRQWVQELVRTHPRAMQWGSEGLIALTQLFELGGNHPVVRFANLVAEAVALEANDLFSRLEANPNDQALQAVVEKKLDEAAKKLEEKVWVTFGHIHRALDCAGVIKALQDTTPPAAVGKDGKPVKRSSSLPVYEMTLTAALAARHPPCGICIPLLPEQAGKDSAKMSGGLMAHLVKFKGEVTPEQFDAFWHAYLERIKDKDPKDGEDVEQLFPSAFTEQAADYEAFKLIAMMPTEQWVPALHLVLKRTSRSVKEHVGDFATKELRETQDALRAGFKLFGRAGQFLNNRADKARVEALLLKQKRGAVLTAEEQEILNTHASYECWDRLTKKQARGEPLMPEELTFLAEMAAYLSALQED